MEIIVDSHAITRNNTETSHVHFLWFRPMVKSCSNCVLSPPLYRYWYNLLIHSEFLSFKCVYVCVWIQLHTIFPPVRAGVSIATVAILNGAIITGLLCCAHSLLPPPTSDSNPGNCYFFIHKMLSFQERLYNWSQMVCNVEVNQFK